MPYLFPEGARFGADHVVLHASSRRHRVEQFPGPLSIKTVVRGRVAWTVGGRDLVLEPGAFLVLGAGEPYYMNIDAERPVETACVFFRDGFVEGIARDLAELSELAWISRLHPRGELSGRVQTLAKRCSAGLMPSGFEEELLLLARDLLLLYEETVRRMSSMTAAKASTREDLFRRVETAREYMHSHSDGPLSLEQAARAACLSPYHFHRSFLQAWNRTPHQYLTELRLGRARTLLEGGLTVAAVCESLGFASTSSFSRLFRSTFGTPPGRIRKIRHSSGPSKAVSSPS